MLDYRTSEIRGRDFNSAHSGMALLVVSIVSMWGDGSAAGACPASLLMCPAASWPPSMTTQPTNVSSPTHRTVNHCLLHNSDWLVVRKRWAAHGHQWAVINRRPGACLLVAADFLGGATAGVNPLRLSRDSKRVHGDYVDRPSQPVHARLLSIELRRVGQDRRYRLVARSLDTCRHVWDFQRLRHPRCPVYCASRLHGAYRSHRAIGPASVGSIVGCRI